jgi:hypothetical protein
MILVLCEDADVSALWAVSALRLRGHRPNVVTATELATAEGWRHRLGVADPDCEIRLRSGQVLRVSETSGVLNRLASLPEAWLRQYGGPDRAYAIQEMHAFYLSWLHALHGPILNPPTPQGLCGNWRHPSAWTALAVQAGLPAQPYLQSSNDDPERHWQISATPARVHGARLHVVGQRVVGSPMLVEAHGAACLRLAAAAGAPLLGIDFAPDFEAQDPEAQHANPQYRMIGATVLPDLTGGGEALVDALQQALAP